jgi:hypothetical protein
MTMLQAFNDLGILWAKIQNFASLPCVKNTYFGLKYPGTIRVGIVGGEAKFDVSAD